MPGQSNDHRGHRVPVADRSRSPSPVETQRLIDAERPGSVRCLIEVTELRFDRAGIDAFRRAGDRSQPAVLERTVAGLSALQRTACRLLTTPLRMNTPAFAWPIAQQSSRFRLVAPARRSRFTAFPA